MSNKQELLHLILRKDNGQIGYMSKGISIPEFYNLIQPKQQNISVNVLIDFYPIIDTLYSLHTQKQDDDIYIKFNSLYSYWNDAKTYQDKQIILSSFQQLKLSSNELLNILKIKLEENPFSRQDYSHQKHDKIKNFIEYSDMYIETILCFIHSKASLEIKSFQQDTVLSDYIKFLKKIIIKLYLNAISNPNNNDPYDSSFLQYLALEKSNELENFLKFHGNKYNIFDFQIYLFNKLELQSYCQNNYILDYKYYDNYEINIAILLRDTLFKIESLSKLLEKLKEENVDWSSESNDIEELKSFLEKQS